MESIQSRSIVVTGGAGFIGSHLVDSLVSDGCDVTVIDNFDPYYDPELKRANIAQALASGQVQLHEIDICDRDSMESVIRAAAPSAIVHLAARAGVRSSFQDPLEYERVNIQGTMQVLDMAHTLRVPQCVVASSSSVYGNHPDVPFVETIQGLQPISPYGATKLASETICRMYADVHKLQVACLRFFTVYGPRQRPDMAIAGFTQKILAGETIELFAGGVSSRDYTFVHDIVNGIRGTLIHPRPFEIYNIGNATVVTLRELVHTLETVLGRKADVRLAPAQPGDVQRTFSDISKAQKILGYQPTTSLEAGFRQYVEWLDAMSAGRVLDG